MSRSLAGILEALALAAALFAASAAQAQEHVHLMTQLRSGLVTSVAFSPDGRFVITASSDKTAQLWDVASGKQIRAFEGHTSLVSSVAVSPDGRFVITGSRDKTARLWDVASGKQLRAFEGHADSVTSVSFAPDGRSVITGSEDKTARLWDVASGKQIRTFEGHEGSITAVAFSPEGRSVITASWEKARLWDVASGQQVRIFDGHTVTAIATVAFSPDGRSVITGGDDNRARLWNVANGEQICTFEGHTGPVTSVAFSPDGHSVITGSDDRTARIWNVANGKQLRAIEGHKDSVRSVAFSPDGRSAITGSDDQTARLWDVASGQQIRAFEGRTAVVASVAFSPDGRFVITASGDNFRGEDNSARLWDVASGQQTRAFEGHTAMVQHVAFSPDGHSVITVGGDDSLRLWDLASGKQIRVFEKHTNWITSVAFSPDGRFVITGSGDNTAQLWDVASGQQIRAFEGHASLVTSVAVSPDSRSVVTGSADKTARLWDAASGRQIRAFEGNADSVTSVAFSPDGRSLITGSSDKTARLWDVVTGQQIRVFEGHTAWVTSLAFSPDGRSLITGSWDNTVRMWDVASGKQVRAFEGHIGKVNSVAFSPNGRFVITGGWDTTTRLWDAATGEQLATLLGFDHGGWGVTDSEGRYDSDDPDNTPGMIWATDTNRVIELKQLKDDYYTPNLLPRILKTDRLPAVKGLDLVPAPPELVIKSPYKPESNRLTLSIAAQGGGVGRLVVSVNGRAVAVLEHPVANSAAKSSGRTELTVDLSAATLKPGVNTITAYAFNAGNQIRSHEATANFTVVPHAEAATGKGFGEQGSAAMSAGYKPRFYAIVVGTASFAGNSKMNLAYPAHDAESMMTGLEIGADKLFGKENVHLHLLTSDAKDESGQPTKKNIVAAFADVMKQAKQTDVLLVYLSGHGVNLRTEKDSYYYLTTDARSLDLADNPELRDLSTVSGAELKQWLGAKDMPLKEVLILDTCAAGAANEELAKLVEKRDVPPDQRRAVEFLKDTTGTIILMGSAADRVSYEASKYGQGLLTYALLDGMHGRSVGGDSTLEVSHWFQNASEDVPLLAASIGGIQKPVIAMPKGTGFPVARLEPADQARIPLAAIKPELLHLSCHDSRDHDPLGLAALVRERLRDISQPAARGPQADPPIIYHDDMIDGPADALTPKILYTVSADGSSVNLELRIDQEDNTLKELPLALSTADKTALAGAAAAKLVEMAGEIPLKRTHE